MSSVMVWLLFPFLRISLQICELQTRPYRGGSPTLGKRQSYCPNCSLVNTWTTDGRWPGISVYSVLCIVCLRPQSLRRLAWQPSLPISQTLRSTSVTRLQLLRKPTDTGTSTAQTAETHWSTRKRFRALPWLVTPACSLANVICARSWRLCGISRAVPVTLLHSPCGMPTLWRRSSWISSAWHFGLILWRKVS